ncbi:Thioredoxin domain-containing protein [Methanocella conradii HZ254]|uniref:Thioredoxin domain-containing protein n=1 Tax=Methanocella conradii (strain DSM 24694 / JCM 17849 / CGMCC 1.5162 / HZ254) TaxID=1041930 RepID=H8I4Y6_METCZ|nr:thioredoxin family protein [Methanocella conradii]AFD01080.1 Thioredoxin domain-containing protein [Methanocella conradii HZ254]MDI6897831.1 thioredoxin family protein [Methanocella conradii]
MIAKRLIVWAVLALMACVFMAGLAQQQAIQQAKVTMADIDNALTKGPVFIEFETAECGYCRQQRPITQQLEAEYAGKATFFYVDAVENRGLAKAFMVTGVPQMDVIAKKADGKYTYIDRNGAPSDSISASRFMGLTQKDALKKALDAAIQARK